MRTNGSEWRPNAEPRTRNSEPECPHHVRRLTTHGFPVSLAAILPLAVGLPWKVGANAIAPSDPGAA